MNRLFFALAALTITTHAYAGIFTLYGYGTDLGTPVSHIVANVVTNDFTTKFPAEKYAIVVIYEHTRFGNDNICYAIAGVALRKKKTDLAAQVPLWRFSSHTIDRNSGSWKIAQVRECQAEVIRGAVGNMMSISPNELKKKAGL